MAKRIIILGNLGLRHGYGQWTSSQYKYEGEWKMGKPDGCGTLIKNALHVHQGSYKNGKKHGSGREIFQNGDQYYGNYKEGRPQGYGTYKWSQGSIYRGNFRNGYRTGHGNWSNQDGDNFEGNYFQDKKKGYGHFLWVSGNQYKGNFENDLKHGYGQMYWNDGSYYKGQWLNGIQHGKGQMYQPGQQPVVGIFENNVLVQFLQQNRFPKLKSRNSNNEGKRVIRKSRELFHRAKNMIEQNQQFFQDGHLEQIQKEYSTILQNNEKEQSMNQIPIIMRRKVPIVKQKYKFNPRSTSLSLKNKLMFSMQRQMKRECGCVRKRKRYLQPY